MEGAGTDVELTDVVSVSTGGAVNAGPLGVLTGTIGAGSTVLVPDTGSLVVPCSHAANTRASAHPRSKHGCFTLRLRRDTPLTFGDPKGLRTAECGPKAKRIARSLLLRTGYWRRSLCEPAKRMEDFIPCAHGRAQLVHGGLREIAVAHPETAKHVSVPRSSEFLRSPIASLGGRLSPLERSEPCPLRSDVFFNATGFELGETGCQQGSVAGAAGASRRDGGDKSVAAAGSNTAETRSLTTRRHSFAEILPPACSCSSVTPHSSGGWG